jgi:hypothetical protein
VTDAITRLLCLHFDSHDMGKEDSADQLRTALNVVAIIVDTLTVAGDCTDEDVMGIIRPLLGRLSALGLSLNPRREQAGRCRLAACLLGILRLIQQKHYDALFIEMGHSAEAKLLDALFSMLLHMVTTDVFPADWFVMRLAMYDTLLKAVCDLATPLLRDFLRVDKGKMLEHGLWVKYFELCGHFMCQRDLKQEDFAESKRAKMRHPEGDRRQLMAEHILGLWSQLGERKAFFVPDLVGPFQEMALVPLKTVRQLTLPVFFDMLQQQGVDNAFERVSTKIMESLSEFVANGAGDNKYADHFETVMMARLEEAGPAAAGLKKDLKGLTDNVQQLMSLLLDLRDVPEGKQHRDQRAGCIGELIQFFHKNAIFRELSVRYAERLADIDVSAGFFIEAGHALKIHADKLAWDDTVVEVEPFEDADGSPKYPQQTSRERRAVLYRRIIDFYDRGHAWERALELCDELGAQLQNHLLDYTSLSKLLTDKSRYVQHILTGDAAGGKRSRPQYFRVGYYGASLPASMRNQTFIYRGSRNDHITMFCERIREQFPQAELIMAPKKVTDEWREGQAQRIMITKVEPVVRDLPAHLCQPKRPAPKALKAWYEENETNEFVAVRPYHEGKKTDNEFETLWTEKRTYYTESKLPCEQNRSKVIQKGEDEDVELISPLGNAIDSMEEKNKSLKAVITEISNDPSASINPLTMELQGVLDAAVMGGTEKYR